MHKIYHINMAYKFTSNKGLLPWLVVTGQLNEIWEITFDSLNSKCPGNA